MNYRNSGSTSRRTRTNSQAMDHARSRAAGTSTIRPLAAVALAIGIFIFDTAASFDVAVGALYVLVLLIAAPACGVRAIVAVAAGCVVLLTVSTFLTGHLGTAPGAINTALRSL